MNSKSEDINLVTINNVKFFIHLFDGIAVDIYQIFKKNNIPNDVEYANYHFLPEETIKNLISNLGVSIPIKDFLIRVSLAIRRDYIPDFIKNIDAKTGVKEALEQCCKLISQHNTGAKIILKEVGGKWWLIRQKSFSNDVKFQYGELFSVIFMNELLNALIGSTWSPQEIGIQCNEINQLKLLPCFKNTQFYIGRPVTALYIPNTFIETDIDISLTAGIATIQAENKYEMNFLSLFKLAIRPYLSTGKLPISLAADILNMNVRTIQRRLKSENTKYSTVIDEMLLEKMQDQLNNTELSITTISAQLGYSDAAHFTRAFKRLMNMTPKEYRKRNHKAL